MRLVQRPLLWLPAALVVVGCVAAAAPLGPAGLLPRPVATEAVLLALGLLVESFGHQVHWRWRTRHRAGTRALVTSGERA